MMQRYLVLWRCLAPNHRLGAVALIVGNLIAAALEVMGLALFGIVLLRITQPGSLPPGFWLTAIAGPAGTADLKLLVIWCGAVYLCKNATLAALAWLEARLAFGVQTHLSVKVLATVLEQDYEVTSRTDSSANINLLTGGMAAISHNLLLPGLTLLSEVTLMLGLVSFLLITQPVFSAGLLATIGFIAGVLVLVSRRVVLQLGRQRHRVEDARLRLLAGIFAHLREMYVYAAGTRAVDHLLALMSRLGATNRGFQMLAAAPRFVLEITLVGALLAVIFVRADAGVAPTLVVTIGVFGVAGFRLLLGINRVVSSVQIMRFSGAIVTQIAEILSSAVMSGTKVVERTGPSVSGLRLVGVGYAYVPGAPVLLNLDFELPRRSFVAVKGRSGAGKSTMLEIIAGLRTPTSGVIELDGEPVANKQALIGRVGYAGQQPAVFPDTIRANVAFGQARCLVDDGAVWRALARVHLDDVVRALPGQLDHMLDAKRGLSGGQVQRLALARALYMECEYLLLDEPTAAMDAETEQQLLVTFKELAATTGVLVISHRTAPLRAADAVWELVEGRLVAVTALGDVAGEHVTGQGG